jgi:alpha-ketoglutarate-dependent taurine dioxygenase
MITKTASPKHMPAHPDQLTSTAVWNAETLPGSPGWDQPFSAAEVAEFADVCAGKAIAEATVLTERFAEFADILEDGSGVVLMRGLPMDCAAEERLGEVFAELADFVGTRISQSAAGKRLFRVEDAGHAAASPKARGPNTRKALSFHSDRCDVIGFLCVRQADSGGDNLIVSTPALHNTIREQRPDLLPLLYQPFPWKRHNVDPANPRSVSDMPVFSMYEDHFASNLMRVLILRAHEDPELPNLSSEQLEALDLVESLSRDPVMHVRFRQEPGDVVFLNNFVTLHSRTAFADGGSQGRLIYRVWLSMPNSRPLDPVWAPNYGATAAGAIRGGIH